MRFIIKHEIPGRIRIHVDQKRMSCTEADTLLYYLNTLECVTQAKVYERTADACVCFTGEKGAVIQAIRKFRYESVEVPETVPANSGRKLNRTYKERLISKVALHYAGKMLLPYPVRSVWTTARSLHYLKEGIKSLAKRKLEVSVLDATAIGVSILRGNMDTASSVMFLLGVGETLEEWTHKKSVSDLARSMSLNVSKVWVKSGEQEILIDSRQVKEEDQVIVHMGNIIPFDGLVTEGEGMVNQSSLTGEPLPVHREKGGYVYAGSVLEEGEITFMVRKASGSSRYEKIVTMIEESEKLKSSVEGKAEKLADRLVPVTLAGTIAAWFLTRNVTKALSVLMVDFSCALKLAMPITVLSAIRQAGNHDITVKGGKYLEAVAEAQTIVFDKAGFVEREKASGRKVLMVGDGVNDSPALSAADVGIAISDGAELAREIADITISADDLYQIVRLKRLSNALMKRIQRNYRKIVGINTVLILMGIGGVMQPTVAAILHNISTLTISLQSMQNLLIEERKE